MLLNDKENKEKKSDFFKDILIAFMVIFISLGCFFTYNPADSPIDLGSDGMNFATYPLGVASFLTVLGLIYLVISIKKYLSSSDHFDFIGQLLQAIKDNRSLYFKRLGTVGLLILFASTCLFKLSESKRGLSFSRSASSLITSRVACALCARLVALIRPDDLMIWSWRL